jgi:flagellar hook assembly protein FlgD
VEGATGALPLRLRVSPNPFHSGARITAPGAGRVEIVDATGRRVRGVKLGEGAGAFNWDGRDERGRTVPPGLYFARYEGAAGRSVVKVMKLDAGGGLP